MNILIENEREPLRRITSRDRRDAHRPASLRPRAVLADQAGRWLPVLEGAHCALPRARYSVGAVAGPAAGAGQCDGSLHLIARIQRGVAGSRRARRPFRERTVGVRAAPQLPPGDPQPLPDIAVEFMRRHGIRRSSAA